jgi:VWFA-related protein
MSKIQLGLNAALQKLRPEDEVCIYRAEPGLELAQPLTRERAAIEQALDRIGEYQSAWLRQIHGKHSKSKSAAQKEGAETSAQEPYPKTQITDMTYALLAASQYLRAQRPRSRVQLIAVTSDLALIRTRLAEDVLHQVLAAEAGVSALVTLKNKVIAGVKNFIHVLDMRPDIRMQNIDQPAVYLAEKTGGMVINVKDDDFEKALERVLGDITSRYSLFYRLENESLDDHFQNLKVTLQPPREDVRIRYRRGYYAWKQPPPAQPQMPRQPQTADNGSDEGHASPQEGLFYLSPSGRIPVPAAEVAGVKGRGLAQQAMLTWGISGVRLVQIFDKPKAAIQISQPSPLPQPRPH